MESSREAVPGGPWYRLRPRVALVVASGLFAAVVAAETLDTRASDAIALMYVLPIALMAVSYGLRGGLVAAAAGYVAFSVFALTTTSGYLGVDGWLSRAAAMFLLGGLLGHATDRSERASALALDQQRLRLLIEEQNRRYGEGIEISDSILQYVAAARWRIEQGRHEEAAALLGAALARGQKMVGQLLPDRLAEGGPEAAGRPSLPLRADPVRTDPVAAPEGRWYSFGPRVRRARWWAEDAGRAGDFDVNPNMEES